MRKQNKLQVKETGGGHVVEEWNYVFCITGGAIITTVDKRKALIGSAVCGKHDENSNLSYFQNKFPNLYFRVI